ncbi:MAG: hypothetical protein D3924_04110, partial [Candidatus Electrothrix sp. AR4]|nr:hypothetical protein [Candidatus Electrothrix sp. AR4]
TAHSKIPLALSLPAGSYEVEVANKLARSSFKKKVRLTDDSGLQAVLSKPKLTIQLNVNAVHIKVDKKEHLVQGKQFSLSLPVGEYHLAAKKKGYVTIKKVISLKKDTKISLTLSPVRHALTLAATMDKIAISVRCENGERRSGTVSRKAPLKMELLTGNCTVQGEKKGYTAFSKKINIFSEQIITVQLAKKIKKKIESVRTKPAVNTKRQSAPAPAASHSSAASSKECRNEISVGMPELCN